MISYTPLVFITLILLHGVVTSLRRAERARRRADSYRDELTAEAELRPGDALVSGRVAYAQDAGEAMRVDMVQVGSESESSGVWTHSWTEISRKLTVHPFYLVQTVRGAGASATQRRIRVEPSAASQLYDELDGKILVSLGAGGKWQRHRAASLVPEERIWVVGRLSRDRDPEASPQLVGYRENATTENWMLRGAPNLLVSSVPLVEHFLGRARLHRVQAAVCALALLVPVFFLAARLDRVAGETVTGTVTSVSTSTNDDTDIVSYQAEVAARGQAWSSESHASAIGVGAPFTLRVGTWSSNDGDEVHWTGGELGGLFAALFGSFVLRVLLRAYSRRRLPWFRSKRPLVEGGSGRLPQGNVTA